MGNRVVVIFTDGKGEYSPCVYLHWGASALGQFLETWRKLMVGREGDVQYGAARFVGVCHEAMDGNMSLGIWDSRIPAEATTAPADAEIALQAHDPGDAGVAVVNVSTYKVQRLSRSDYAMSECPVPDGWTIGNKLPKGSDVPAFFALPMALPHVGHDGAAHHWAPFVMLACVLIGAALVWIARRREESR